VERSQRERMPLQEGTGRQGREAPDGAKEKEKTSICLYKFVSRSYNGGEHAKKEGMEPFILRL